MKIVNRIKNLELRSTNNEFNPNRSQYLEIVKWFPYVGEHPDLDEYCYTIASFHYDKDGYPELTYCGNRPLELTSEEHAIFIDLVKLGYMFILEDGEFKIINYR